MRSAFAAVCAAVTSESPAVPERRGSASWASAAGTVPSAARVAARRREKGVAVGVGALRVNGVEQPASVAAAAAAIAVRRETFVGELVACDGDSLLLAVLAGD